MTIAITELGIFLIGLYLLSVKLRELPVLISLGAVELLAFFLANNFLEKKKTELSVQDLILIGKYRPHYDHLIVHFVNTGIQEEYPDRLAYVLNKYTKYAYLIPPYIDHLSEKDVIDKEEHKTQKEFAGWFDKNNFNIQFRMPKTDELLPKKKVGESKDPKKDGISSTDDYPPLDIL